jgi:nicotinamide-nucleotide amidase
MRGKTLHRWVTEVGRELRRKGEILATAESCSGGLLAQVLTSKPGSSDYYWGGVVTYANESKIALLGVRPSTLKRYGAVSALTAREMALGMARRSGADHTLAITGIAGPGGGTCRKTSRTCLHRLGGQGENKSVGKHLLGFPRVNKKKIRPNRPQLFGFNSF